MRNNDNSDNIVTNYPIRIPLKAREIRELRHLQADKQVRSLGRIIAMIVQDFLAETDDANKSRHTT